MKRTILAMAACLELLLAVTADAEVFHRIPLQELNITQGQLPATANIDESVRRIPWQRRRMLNEFMQPYAVIDGTGEVYVTSDQRNGWWPNRALTQEVANTQLAVRMPEGQDIKGWLFVPAPDWREMRKIGFSIPAAHASEANARDQFLRAKEQHYRRLMNLAIPGAAWFRHQMVSAQKERANEPFTQLSPIGGARATDNAARRGELTRTYGLFTGGRAVSENLQLDRALRLRRTEDEQMVPLDQIEGVTTAELDWTPIIEGMTPETDALASAVPKDQHALFFPSFSAMLTMMDEAARQGTPVLRLLEPRSEDARTRERYERQLCLKADELSRRLGPQLVASVAYTGSDPYLRTGSDLAVLFEAKNPMALTGIIAAKQGAVVHGDIERVTGRIAGVQYQGVVSPWREVSSYLAQSNGIVVVANSLIQLEAILKTIQKKTPSVAEAPEYIFFRDRYKKSEEETAFLVLTDATIRRWCSPKWRIAASRRTRAAAALSELKARYLQEFSGGAVEAGPLTLDDAPEHLGKLSLTTRGVASSRYGTLEFLTPIIEIDITQASKAEKEAYDWFRRAYQRNWRGFFDPIAIRFVLEKEEIAADMTVRPLIAGSDYRQIMAVTGNAAVEPHDGDPHKESMIHMVMSLDKESEPVQQISNFAVQMAPGLQANPLGWVGNWLSVYVDQDPLWEELHKRAEASQDSEAVIENFIDEHGWQIPVAVAINVKNSFKLTGFLAAVRAFIEQTSPGNTAWETRKHGEMAYVRVSPTQQARRGMSEDERQKDMGVYYAITPDALVLSLNESVVKRALTRQAERQAASDEERPAPPFGQPWLGKSICGQAGKGALTVLQAMYEESLNRTYQRRSWGNLFVLNEWRRRFETEDPAAFHLRQWHTTLICPGGGQYEWDDEHQTVMSTVYGSPAQPRLGTTPDAPLQSIQSGNFGITFEGDGLRARVRLQRATQE